MSCKTMYNEELASTIPVNPPTVNRKTNPRAHSIAGDHLIFPPCNLASQLNTVTPVGIAMIIVSTSCIYVYSNGKHVMCSYNKT